MRQISSIITVLLTVLLVLSSNVQPAYVGLGTASSQDHIVVLYPYGPDTVDPAWAYDTASCELIFNVYEPLIFYAVNRSAPPAQAGKVDQFIPYLATNWTISPDGKTYTFKLREDVKFHNNETLTTEDIEYSFERTLVHDVGPVWMIYEALLGCWHANLSDPDWHLKIENTVQHNATHVWFNLIEPYTPFLQILCQSWSSIVNKNYCVEHGDWPANETAGKWFWPGGNWKQYHDPEASPLDTGGDWMCGTGPYKLDYWTHGEFGEYSLVKFGDYWQGWPAPHCDSCVGRATVRFIPYWVKRKEMLLNRTADIITVPRENIEEMEGVPGIRCVKDLLTLQCNAFFFTFNISTTDAWGGLNPYMGVPGGLPPSTFNETGIPSDFFNDTDLRKGFAYSFNWTKCIEETYLDEALQPATPVVEGLPYRNPTQETYCLNLTEAEAYFKRAWEGQVWEKGFTMTLVYHTGSVPRFIWIETLKENVESLNPKFHINMLGIDWYYLLANLVHSALPMFYLGWLADYPDPHNFLYEFMHSNGAFSDYQRYSNETVDALVEEGLETLNNTRRREVYYELQRIYHDDCLSVPTAQPLGRHWERDCVQGWYHNPAYPGIYFYHLWKRLIGDLDGDGHVYLYDLTILGSAWNSRPDDPQWNADADLDGDGHVFLYDLTIIGSHWDERNC